MSFVAVGITFAAVTIGAVILFAVLSKASGTSRSSRNDGDNSTSSDFWLFGSSMDSSSDSSSSDSGGTDSSGGGDSGGGSDSSSSSSSD